MRNLSSSIPRWAPIIAVPILTLAVIIALSFGKDSNDNEKNRVPPTPVLLASSPDVPPTSPLPQAPSPAEALPVPVEDAAVPPEVNRASCSAIRGTAYGSVTEQQWFYTNCLGSQPGTAGAAASAVQGIESATGQRLVISKAGINADILVTRMSGGKMPDPKGYFTALTYDMSGYSGLGGTVQSGNMVISGHVDCARCNNGGVGTAVFWNVRSLSVGDGAQVRTSDGGVVNYVVIASGSYTANMDYTRFVASDAADMTIITCTGSFSGGEYDRRHVVQFRKA